GVRGFNSANRCGPTNLLAGALLQGGDVAARFIEKSAASAGGHLVEGQKQDLKDIASRIRSRTATYDDLAYAGELLYRSANRRMTLGQWLNENPVPPRLTAAQATQLGTLLAKGDRVTAAELRQISALMSISLDWEVNVSFVEEPGMGG